MQLFGLIFIRSCRNIHNIVLVLCTLCINEIYIFLLLKYYI